MSGSENQKAQKEHARAMALKNGEGHGFDNFTRSLAPELAREHDENESFVQERQDKAKTDLMKEGKNPKDYGY